MHRASSLAIQSRLSSHIVDFVAQQSYAPGVRLARVGQLSHLPNALTRLDRIMQNFACSSTKKFSFPTISDNPLARMTSRETRG